jgi:hypothetical protein
LKKGLNFTTEQKIYRLRVFCPKSFQFIKAKAKWRGFFSSTNFNESWDKSQGCFLSPLGFGLIPVIYFPRATSFRDGDGSQTAKQQEEQNRAVVAAP